MGRLLILAWLALGCGGSAEEFDPSLPGVAQVLVEPRLDSRSGFAILADNDGYIVFWSGPAIEGMPDRGPVFAVRPGETPRALNVGVSAQSLTATAVAGGFLVCWDSGGYSAGELRASGCLLLDHELVVVREWRPEFGSVIQLARVGTQLYAKFVPDTEPAPMEWRALDETGDPTGEPMAPPCSPRSPMAFSALGVACLVPSDPTCGDQNTGPSDCTYAVELRDPDGTLRFSIPEVAPFGEWGSLTDGKVAARDDGFLVTWTGTDDDWHAVPVSPSGVRGAQLDVPDLAPEAVHAVGGGYLATWTDGVNSPRLYRWPMMMLVSVSGALARPPEAIVTQRDDLPFQYGPVAVGTSGDGVAVVWEGALDTEGYPSALVFRSLGSVR